MSRIADLAIKITHAHSGLGAVARLHILVNHRIGSVLRFARTAFFTGVIQHLHFCPRTAKARNVGVVLSYTLIGLVQVWR